MSLEADRGMHWEQIVACGDRNIVVVHGHGSGVHGKVTRQVVCLNSDPPDPAGSGVDVYEAVKTDADRIVVTLIKVECGVLMGHTITQYLQGSGPIADGAGTLQVLS